MSKITIYFKEIIKSSGPNPGQAGPIVVYIIRSLLNIRRISYLLFIIHVLTALTILDWL